MPARNEPAPAHAKAVNYCPAVLDHEARMFEVPCPVDVRLGFRFDDKGKVRPGMQHVRRIIGISTYGAPWTYVKLLNDGGRRMLTRALRMNCGVRTPTTWIGLYAMDTAGDRERAAFLDRVEHRLAHLHGSPSS